MKWYLLLPLASSLLYVGGAMFIKRGAQLGAGIWRTTIVSNLVTAIAFMVLLPMGGSPQWMRFWEPLALAGLFIAGQILTILSLSRGDVSVATPVLGIKTVLVAWLTTLLLATSLPWQLWTAAALTSIGLIWLNRTSGMAHRKVGQTVALSLAAALAFALFDVLVQKWSRAWGAGRLLPVAFGCVGILSLAMLPLVDQRLREMPPAAWPPLGCGSLFLALQALLLITTMARFGDATAVNVVYSARGLWSVAAVWLIGHWFANDERHLGASVLRWRLAGAATMTAAIVLVLTR